MSAKPTPRAKAVAAPADWSGRTAADIIVLPHDGRYRRRITMRTEADLVFLLDLPEATHLRHGDGLLLEDGRIIGVVAAEEPVAEITAVDSRHLSRIAWHIGNRHVPAEILSNCIRIMPDPIIEDMVRRLGGTVQHVEARFEPEGGAYEHAAHGHTHHHRDGNSQDHGHNHAHDQERHHHRGHQGETS